MNHRFPSSNEAFSASAAPSSAFSQQKEGLFPQTIVVFSHLRWDFVYQRPQHLLSRFAKAATVYFIEEPVFGDAQQNFQVSKKDEKLSVLEPHLPSRLNETESINAQKQLLETLLEEENIDLGDCAFWYYTPMALQFSNGFQPAVTVYDCMDELSAFKFAPPKLKDLEAKLMAKADVVFTGGHSLYEAKKAQHPNIHPFPSSIDKAHFGKAKTIGKEPEDQQLIPHPRLGFFGVIDERFDIELISEMATERSDWQFILIGPIVKIDPETLPQNPNIHYLGSKSYGELPAYLSGWDVALIPFALNESTRFISPTKTPEYLAAGIPVVSTAIRDVVQTYGANGLAEIADDAASFIQKTEQLLEENKPESWKIKVEQFLSGISWDKTFRSMWDEISKVFTKANSN